MPLKECVVNGKKGWQYGSQHCFTGPDAKKQAIKQMIAIFGPDKFQKHLHSEAAIRDFGGRENITFAKAVFKEEFPRGMFDTYLSSIANYLSKSDDGQNDSSKNDGDMLDENCEAATEVDNAGDLSGNPSKTGDGSGNEFNKKGSASTDWNIHTGPTPPDFTCPSDTKTVYDPAKPPAEASVNWNIHTGPSPQDFTKDEKGEVVYDPQKPPANAAEDNYGKNGKNDGDGDEPDPVAKGDLDTDTKKVGSHTVVPPYNKEASPETDPSKSVPNTEPPSRNETTPPNNDNRKTLDSKIQYQIKSSEEDSESNDPEMTMSEVWLNACAYISEEERNQVPEEDFAGPKGSKSYPIRNGKDVEDAARLVGHSPSPTQTKKRIIEIAHRKGLQAHLPESWKKPEHQTAYEQTLNLFGKLSADEKKSLIDKLQWEEMSVNEPQENQTSSY